MTTCMYLCEGFPVGCLGDRASSAISKAAMIEALEGINGVLRASASY